MLAPCQRERAPSVDSCSWRSMKDWGTTSSVNHVTDLLAKRVLARCKVDTCRNSYQSVQCDHHSTSIICYDDREVQLNSVWLHGWESAEEEDLILEETRSCSESHRLGAILKFPQLHSVKILLHSHWIIVVSVWWGESLGTFNPFPCSTI